MLLPGTGGQFQPFADLEVRLDLMNKPLEKGRRPVQQPASTSRGYLDETTCTWSILDTSEIY